MEGPDVGWCVAQEVDGEGGQPGGFVEGQALFRQPCFFVGVGVQDAEGEVVGVASLHRVEVPEAVLPASRHLAAGHLEVISHHGWRCGVGHGHGDVLHTIEEGEQPVEVSCLQMAAVADVGGQCYGVLDEAVVDLWNADAGR